MDEALVTMFVGIDVSKHKLDVALKVGEKISPNRSRIGPGVMPSCRAG